MKTKKQPITLNSAERTIVQLCVDNPTGATLAQMTDKFVGRARRANGSRWTYATSVDKHARIRWLANLTARNGVRRPVDRGLIRKVRPGLYRATSAGIKAVAR